MTRDQRRYDALQRLGCVACELDGRESQAEVHHLVDKGYRRLSGGNQASISLCPWHHRGVSIDGKDATYMRLMYGPSKRLEGKAFSERYGSDRDLLALVNERLCVRPA